MTPMTVRIDEQCTACGNCLITCPERALLRAPKRPAVIDQRCTGCGACIEVCPVDAIVDLFLDDAQTADESGNDADAHIGGHSAGGAPVHSRSGSR